MLQYDQRMIRDIGPNVVSKRMYEVAEECRITKQELVKWGEAFHEKWLLENSINL